MNRTGKIALLPRPLRDELNRRLEQNVPGRTLTAWLNSLPEVQALLTAHFHGTPINQQNLSNWRRSGFAEWQARQDFFEALRHLAEDADGIEATLGPIADQAARMAALQFALLLNPSPAIRSTDPGATPGHASAPPLTSEAVKSLCQITRAIATLRRGDLAAARFKASREASTLTGKARRQTNPENTVAATDTPPPSVPARPPATAPLHNSVPATVNQAKSSHLKLYGEVYLAPRRAFPGHGFASLLHHPQHSLPQGEDFRPLGRPVHAADEMRPW